MIDMNNRGRGFAEQVQQYKDRHRSLTKPKWCIHTGKGTMVTKILKVDYLCMILSDFNYPLVV